MEDYDSGGAKQHEIKQFFLTNVLEKLLKSDPDLNIDSFNMS